MIPRVQPLVIPTRIPFAVKRVIWVSSEMRAFPEGERPYLVMPLGPYMVRIDGHDSNSTAYPKASPTAPPTRHPSALSLFCSVNFELSLIAYSVSCLYALMYLFSLARSFSVTSPRRVMSILSLRSLSLTLTARGLVFTLSMKWL